MCAACTRNNTQLDFRLAKLGVFGSNNKVTHHGQFATATQCKATDRCNDGLANAANGFPVAGDEIFFVDIVEIVFGHGRNVGAGSKGFFAARHDDAANGFVGIKVLQSQAQFVHQGAIQSVQSFRAIQCDDANFAAFNADFNVFVRQKDSPIRF